MTGTPSRRDLGRTTEMISEVTRRLHQGTHHLASSPAEAALAHEVLLDLSAASARLARELDQLATASDTGGTEPCDTHVALDQAAAAAEDLGNCARTAALAITDEFA